MVRHMRKKEHSYLWLVAQKLRINAVGWRIICTSMGPLLCDSYEDEYWNLHLQFRTPWLSCSPRKSLPPYPPWSSGTSSYRWPGWQTCPEHDHIIYAFWTNSQSIGRCRNNWKESNWLPRRRPRTAPSVRLPRRRPLADHSSPHRWTCRIRSSNCNCCLLHVE